MTCVNYWSLQMASAKVAFSLWMSSLSAFLGYRPLLRR